MEYYCGTYCISARELIDGGIMTRGSYAKAVQCKRIEVVQRGGGYGNYTLIAVNSLTAKQRAKLKALYDGDSVQLAVWIRENYETDLRAAAYFFSKDRCGRELQQDKAKEYVVNASVLNTCIKLYVDVEARLRLMNGKYNWTSVSTIIESLRFRLGHTLPTSVFRFRKKVSDYRKRGYEALLSGKFGNRNALKHK